MNTVSSSSSYSTSAATNKGMSGLVSNLDTESMVESLLSGTQQKIDKQTGLKQVTTWKQEFYREIITNINSFQSTYFGSLLSTSLLSSQFFNAMSAITKSEAISISASSKAAAGKTEMQVSQLATASKLQSGGKVSGKLDGAIDLTALDRTVVFKTDSGEVKIDLQKCGTTEELAKQLSDGGIAASADEKTGKLVISGDNISVSSKSSRLGMQMLGASAGAKTVDGKLMTTAAPDADASITIALDGVSHVITLDKMDEAADLKSYLQGKLDSEFGKDAIQVEVDSSNHMTMTTSEGRQIVLSGDKTTFQLFGIQDGQSNKIALGQQLQNVGFAAKLQGSEYQIKINGVDFTFNNTQTVNQIINEINSSKANVRVTYSELEDKFTVESAYTGAGYDIEMEQTQGNLLNVLFGGVAKTGEKAVSNALTTNTVGKSLGTDAWNSVSSVSSFTNGYFKLAVDGQNYSIAVPKRSDEDGGAYTREEVMDLINQGLADRFGYTDGGEQNIALVKNSDDSYQIAVRNGSNVSFAKTDGIYDGTDVDSAKAAKAAESNLQLAFGFEDTNNVAKDSSETLEHLNIDYASLGLNKGDTIDALLAKIKSVSGVSEAAFNKDTGKISIEGSGSISIGDTAFMNQLFGSNTLEFGASQGDATSVQAGQNAKLTINGVATERSTNSFTVSGLNVTLLEETNGETITIDTTRDTDKVYEGIKSFVDAYNKLIGDLNTKISEEASFRKYPPLTSAQKKDMSDREIELWEEKAKTGLLRNDSNIS